MFNFLKRWFFGGKKKDETAPVAVGYARLADIPRGVSLADKTAVVCSGSRMTLFVENALPERLCAGELCWLVPAGDVAVTAEFSLRDVLVEMAVTLCFEADDHFAAYVLDRESITQEDLKTLVAGEMLAMAELESLTPEQLLPGNSEAESRFRWGKLRAGLSLLLQQQGIRCTGVTGIRKLAEVLENMPAEDAPGAEMAETEVPEEVRDEIRRTLLGVKSDADWDAFMDELGAAGAIPELEVAEEMDRLGAAYLAREMAAEAVSDKICALLERNARANRGARQNVANWNALATRMRWMDGLLGEESVETDTETLPAGGDLAESLPKKLRRPGIWYILRRASADEKLQRFLVEAVTKMQGSLTLARTRLSDFSRKAELEKVGMMLNHIQQQLDMVPEMNAPTRQLRRQQRPTAELLSVLRRCVTGTQMAFGLLRDLAAEALTAEEFDAKAAELKAVLAVLDADVRNRRDVYGVNA